MPPKTPKRSKAEIEESEEPSTPVSGEISTANEPVTPSNMKVAELRDALTARGLSPKGLKKELIERLDEAIKADSGPSKRSNAVNSKDVEAEEDSSVDEAEIDGDQVDYSLEDDKRIIDEQPIVIERTKAKEHITKENAESDRAKFNEENVSMEVEKQIEDEPANFETRGGVLHVTGFIRPFAVQSAKDLFISHGAVKTFWMDSIKSICFAEFESEVAASACYRSVNGLEFPPGFGKNLEAHFSDPAAMKDAMEKDEATNLKRKVSDSATEGPEFKRPKIGKSLDELFRKTVAKPHLYYLPAKP